MTTTKNLTDSEIHPKQTARATRENQKMNAAEKLAKTITRATLRTWGACYNDDKIARLVPVEGLTPRQIAGLGIPRKDVLWVLTRVPLPEGPAHARLALICREAGRHGSTDVCEAVADLCDRVSSGVSRESLAAEFSAARVAAEADAVRGAAWAARTAVAAAARRAAWEAAWAVMAAVTAVAAAAARRATAVEANADAARAVDRMILGILTVVDEHSPQKN
jgi:hypothetical protein